MRFATSRRAAWIFGLRGSSLACGLAAGLASAMAAETASPLAGDWVCAYGCRLTDANPNIEIKGDEADCMNEYGGLFQGRVLGLDELACFRKTARLSLDGQTLTWSDGVVWTRPRRESK